MNKEILKEQINLGYSTWKLAELYNTSQFNIRYWLKKFDLKTIKVINNQANVKECPKCKITKATNEFYQSTKSSSYCKDCIVLVNKQRQLRTKQECVNYKGGSCFKCGYNKCLGALEFHHIDPNTKDKKYFSQGGGLAQRGGLTNELKLELDKCVLLCANCHREEHHLS